MKKMLSLISIVSVSTLFLTGCPSGGGGGKSDNVVVNPNTSGVSVGQINYFNNESCNVLNNSYTCTQFIGNQNMTTPQLNFNTLQDFCERINNYQINVGQDGRTQVAYQTRTRLYSERCATVVQPNPQQPPYNPGNPVVPGLKTFTCQLQVKKGNLVFNGQQQQFNLYPTGGSQVLQFRTGFFGRHKIASVSMRYTPALSASANSMDTIEMSTAGVDSETGFGISASITGFAGAENRLEITPANIGYDAERTQLIAVCSSSDALVRPSVPTTGKYKCDGEEIINGRKNKIDYTNPISDVSNTGIALSNSAYLSGDSTVGSGQGLLNLTQTSNEFEESTVQLRTTLDAPMKASIQKIGYSLIVRCSPK